MRRFKATIKFSANFVNNTVIAGNTEKRRQQGINRCIKLLPRIMFDTCLRAALNGSQKDEAMSESRGAARVGLDIPAQP